MPLRAENAQLLIVVLCSCYYICYECPVIEHTWKNVTASPSCSRTLDYPTYGGLIQGCNYPWWVKMELLINGIEVMCSSRQSLRIATNSVWTCATWSWMPPSAIMRSVCRAIWRASTPSEVERLIHQYDMRNIRFTVEWHRESDKDYGVTSLLWFQLSLPGDGNLGASLKPPYSSS